MAYSNRDRAKEYRRLARKVRAASRHISNTQRQRALIDVAECYEILAMEAQPTRHTTHH
jgi:hypothetical protein